MFEIGSEDPKRGLERKLLEKSHTTTASYTTRSGGNYNSQEKIALHFRKNRFLHLQPVIITQARVSKTDERKEKFHVTYEHSFFIHYHETGKTTISEDVFENYLTIISNEKNEWWSSKKYRTRKYYKLAEDDRKKWLFIHAPLISAVNTLKRLKRVPLFVETLHGKTIICTDYKNIIAEAMHLLKTREERTVKGKVKYKTRPMNLDEHILIHAATVREISQ